MGKHETSNTVSVSKYCRKCETFTQHAVSAHRVTHCLDCLDRQERQIAERKAKEEAKGPVAKQGGLF